jgi:site-specific recombinase XerD
MPTIQQAIDYYLETSTTLSEKGIESFIIMQNKLGRIAGIELDEITPGIMRRWLAEQTKLKESSKHLYFTNFKSCVNRYSKDHKLKLDFSDLEGLTKSPKINPDDIKMLTNEQVNYIRDLPIERKIVRQMRDVFLLMCYTGMAVSDMAKFDRSWIFPSTNPKFKFWLKYKRKKTEALCMVPLIDEAMAVIDRWEWPIPGEVRMIKHYCTMLTKITGIHLNPHLARKTCGSLWLEKGMPSESVSRILGHMSISMTQRYYSKITANKIEQDFNRIAEVTFH